ncbi:MAG: RHS repeat-associated core domain-containing protein, partial [Bacteroidales bacterium]
MNPSSTTYYPFGYPLQAQDGQAYRFGFNGKEKDPEWTGQQGSHLDFGARIYDSRIGRWTAVDPKAAKYPGWSPYSAFIYILDKSLGEALGLNGIEATYLSTQAIIDQ